MVGNGSWSEGYTKSEIWNDQLVREWQKTATGKGKSQLDSINFPWYLAKILQSLNNKYNFHISRNVTAKVMVEDVIHRPVIIVVGCEIIIKY